MAGDHRVPLPDSGFEIVRRGYDQWQVDGHLRRLDAEIRILMADREAAVDQATQLARELDESRARAERLRVQVRTLINAPQTAQGMSERMRSMLRLAEDEVADMLARAEAEVTRHRHEADQQVTDLRAAAHAETTNLRAAAHAETTDVRAAAHAEADDLRAAAHAEADAVRAAARADAEQSAAEDARRRAELDAACAAAIRALAAERAAAEQQIAAAAEQAERKRARERSASEARHALVEEDFTIAMDQRRAEALAELEAGRTETHHRNAVMLATATEQAREVVAEAERRAQQIMAAAQRRVVELAALRGRVAEQLSRTRSVLDVALGTLAAEVAERPELVSTVEAPNGSVPGEAQPVAGSPTNGAGAPSPTATWSHVTPRTRP